MRIIDGDLTDPRVVDLVLTHLARARAETAPGSAHALDVSGLQASDIRLWTLWDGDALAGIGALKRLSADHGEVKSMYTAESVRRRGAAGRMMAHIIATARVEGFSRLSLETGSWDYFRPARAFYARHGFTECGPFEGYALDPNSVFMSLDLQDGAGRTGQLVNDIHSQLNSTRVNTILRPASVPELAKIVADAAGRGASVSIAGSRHAMGGQQFGTDTHLIDMSGLDRIISFDRERGIIEVEAGALWPAIIDHCWSQPDDSGPQWSIIQKQTGADALTIGGALAANVHGRGLAMRPIIGDVESFQLVTANGEQVECSRSANADLFRLAIGGYGLFGVIASVKLRLMPRTRLKRVVRVITIDELMPAFEQRIADGYLYGDFQYMTDAASPDFLRRGVFSCYVPTSGGHGAPEHRELAVEDWKRLYRLAFTDKAAAYQAYAGYYLGTDGQSYWSDRHQLSTYLDDYHITLNAELGVRDKTSLMISEIYVPRENLAAYMGDVKALSAAGDLDIIYGTVRLIERDEESVLAWARTNYVCIIFNLRVVHTPAGLEKAQRDFRALIDAALPYGGSYYLTYHRWARKDQVLASYPQMPDFLAQKARHDPAGVFQSDWHRAMTALLT